MFIVLAIALIVCSLKGASENCYFIFYFVVQEFHYVNDFLSDILEQKINTKPYFI